MLLEIDVVDISSDTFGRSRSIIPLDLCSLLGKLSCTKWGNGDETEKRGNVGNTTSPNFGDGETRYIYEQGQNYYRT